MAGNNYANGLINKFFQNKTIQKSYNYYVIISNNNSLGTRSPFKGVHENLAEFEITTDNFPVKPTHIKSVTLPNPQTKFEMFHLGPLVKRHPMFEFENPIVKIEFIEDAYQTIQRFILWMSKRRINGFGEYYPLSESACLDISVIITDDTGADATEYTFKKCSLANATEPTYSYDSNEPITIAMDFSFELAEMQIYNLANRNT